MNTNTDINYGLMAEMALQSYNYKNSLKQIECFHQHYISNEYVTIYVSDVSNLNSSRDIVMAIRGTIWSRPRDLAINTTILLGIEKCTMRYKLYCQMIRTIRFMYPIEDGHRLYLTAHSQGATMCRRLTLQYSSHVTKCYIFNPGFSIPHLYEAIVGKGITQTKSKKTEILRTLIVIYRIKGDLVSYFSKWSISPIIHIHSNRESPWGAHSLINFIEQGIKSSNDIPIISHNENTIRNYIVSKINKLWYSDLIY
jgi:hypothetical protein